MHIRTVDDTRIKLVSEDSINTHLTQHTLCGGQQMHSIKIGALMLAAAFVPNMAAAQDGGIYIEIFGGPTILEDADLDGSISDKLKTDTGFNVGGALGVTVPLLIVDLRLEGQVTYRRNDTERIEAGGLNVDTDGDFSALSGMGNAYVDLDFDTPLAVWAGGGIGYARLDLDFDALNVNAVDNQEDDVLAYQAMAGINYDFNDRTSLSLGYTYFWTKEASFTDEVGDKFDADYKSHDVKLGLVFKL